ncbi:RNA polymerase subunit sigma [Streptomyces sp. VRA16 Mangrove soil]|uniref:RNA polymerase subunit sigma n=1 Tax=Streptomyces sp. VRA16 Mangrove soil TaxID=2817434 RepID=UPI001A9DBAF4|nr:RNA polymerase subunit sigma [Streptomyces sp. VRA16 Mangrove soil]MBO1332510.1 RNA polymerase subunit sigma [Streptomyces sp. VRA16 Mangrove soil]
MGDIGEAASLTELLDERRHLLDVASWMLGLGPEAEDVVAHAYRRWYALSDAQRRRITEPRSWLARTTGTICLARLPLQKGAPAAAGEAATVPGRALAEEVGDILRKALNTLSPAEQAAFFLDAVPVAPPRPVTETMGPRSGPWPEPARRARPGPGEPRAGATPPYRHDQVVHAVRGACAALDAAGLESLLAPDVSAYFDGGGKVRALSRPVHGRRAVGHALLTLLAPQPHTVLQLRPANGRTALVVGHHDKVAAVISFAVTRDLVTRVWAVLNPDKLRAWNRGPTDAVERGVQEGERSTLR